MKRTLTGGLMAAAFGAALAVAIPAPASAQLARLQTAIDMAGNNELLTTVQHRRHWRGGGRHHSRGWSHRRGWGPGAGIGIGLATGALIGGALAAAPRPYYAPGPTPGEVQYCSQRFKSYDPSSGTYLGYDGNRHACP